VDNEEYDGQASGFCCHQVEKSAGWQVSGWKLDTVLLHAVVSKNLLHLSVFRKSGLLGRCWALIAQVAGSLFLCREGFLASRT
jgi:hypothetical protein